MNVKKKLQNAVPLNGESWMEKETIKIRTKNTRSVAEEPFIFFLSLEKKKIYGASLSFPS